MLNNVPKINIGGLKVSLIQGGMGVGVSMSGLASAVANEGGAGVIASVGLGALKMYPQMPSNFDEYAKLNSEALREEIKLARKNTNGVIGVNIMHALLDYPQLVRAAVEENADLIISGAGVPRDLPNYLHGRDIKLVPIVSSARLATNMCIAWGRLGHLPDAVIVEGPEAGGHLGFARYNPEKPEITEHLDNLDFVSHGLERILPQVIEAVKPFETSTRKIPVIAAGGLFYGGDIQRVLDLGVAGVQIATRLVTTDECDASPGFKKEYLRARKEDIVLINSPVGMPGRAINNPFLEAVARGQSDSFVCDYLCLKSCKAEKAQYCIANALVEAQKGIFNRGYAFCGSKAYLCKEMMSVKELFRRLDEEVRERKVSPD